MTANKTTCTTTACTTIACTTIAMPGDEPLAAALGERLQAPTAALEYRRFPDGESYMRIRESLDGAPVALISRLDRPDPKIPALLFAADLARDLGASAVGLVAPTCPTCARISASNPAKR